MQERITFSKAPLREVILEIKFPADMSAACRRDEFYNEIRKDYPIVTLPKLSSLEQNPFAQPSQYTTEDGTRIITCTSETFSFGTSKYESFALFKNECLRLLTIFLDKYKTINKITRIGFRYINHIGIKRSDDKIDLKPYLNFNFLLPNSLNKHLLEFFQTSFFIELEKQTSGIRVSIDNRKDKEGNDFMILDFDLISLKEINGKEIEKYLDNYHDRIEEIFLDIATKEYKESIK